MEPSMNDYPDPAAKKVRGRPKLGELARIRMINVRFSTDELAAIQSAIASGERTDDNVSAWIRDRVIDALGIEVPPRARDIAEARQRQWIAESATRAISEAAESMAALLRDP